MRDTPGTYPVGRFFWEANLMVDDSQREEMLRVILEELKELRVELRQHITDETIEFEKIKETLHRHTIDQALTRQRLNLTTTGIAIAVSGVFTYFLNVVGFHVD